VLGDMEDGLVVASGEGEGEAMGLGSGVDSEEGAGATGALSGAPEGPAASQAVKNSVP